MWVGQTEKEVLVAAAAGCGAGTEAEKCARQTSTKGRTEKILKEGWWMLHTTRRPGRDRALSSTQMSSAVLESSPEVGSCGGCVVCVGTREVS